MPAAYGGRGIHRYSEAATLVGIEVPDVSRNIELKPYALSAVTTDNTADEPFANDLSRDPFLATRTFAVKLTKLFRF